MPCGRKILVAVLLEEPLRRPGPGFLRRELPVVDVGHALFPVEPDLPRPRRQEVLDGEAVRGRELSRALADEEDAVGAVHDELRDLRGRLAALQRAHGAGFHRAAVHDARVELHDALLVRDAAVPDADVVRVELVHVDADDRGVQRVVALDERLPRGLRGLDAVRGRHEDVGRRRRGGFCIPSSGVAGAAPGGGGVWPASFSSKGEEGRTPTAPAATAALRNRRREDLPIEATFPIGQGRARAADPYSPSKKKPTSRSPRQQQDTRPLYSSGSSVSSSSARTPPGSAYFITMSPRCCEKAERGRTWSQPAFSPFSRRSFLTCS